MSCCGSRLSRCWRPRRRLVSAFAKANRSCPPDPDRRGCQRRGAASPLLRAARAANRPSLGAGHAARPLRSVDAAGGRQLQSPASLAGYLAHIAAAGPQAFLAIGDNVYGDHGYRGEADLASFVDAYRLQASHPNSAPFRAAVPVLATWDDHDFGPNDSGGSFFGREWSETLFETFWGSPPEVRDRPGVYQSVTIGPEGQRAQIIMLDTRYFRGELTELPYSEERRPLGNYAPDTATGAEMLGEAQWRWLANTLAEPAELRIVVSSIQVLTDAHDFESWENLPRERERLMRSLAARAQSGLVLLSGDRHSGAIYAEEPAALGERVHELTASSLNLAFVSDDASEREPDAKRLTGMVTQENFGLVDIDWNARTLVLRLMDDRGAEIVSRRVTF